jgi:hypothetical protein
MATERDYSAEYQARLARARAKEFRSYRQEREEQKRARRALPEGATAPVLTPWDRRQRTGLQMPSGPSPDTDPVTGIPDWDYYWPTRTIKPTKVGRDIRTGQTVTGGSTRQARWSARQEVMEVIFRDGTSWHFNEINEGAWRRFKSAPSPGRVIYSQWPPGTFDGNVTEEGGPGGWGNVVAEGRG